MTSSLCEIPFSQADAIASIGCRVTNGGFVSEAPIADPQEDWEIRLRSLQNWICELLIKNQQLRMALMEAKAKAPKDSPESSGRLKDKSQPCSPF